jgi:hypothetical protein
MRTGIDSDRAHPSAQNLSRGRIPVFVGLAAGLVFLLGLGAAFDLVDPLVAVDAGAALAALGGIAAFLDGR